MDCRKAKAITALHKDVLFKVLFLTRKGGFRSPSHKLIAKMASASARTVWTALQRAQALGLLTIIHRRKKVGQRWWNDTNAYVFHVVADVSEAVASIRKFCGTGDKDIITKALGPVDNMLEPAEKRHLSVQEYLALIQAWNIEKAPAPVGS